MPPARRWVLWESWMRWADFDRVWFLTWTTYGTWLPGDSRGFVSPKFDRPETESRTNKLGEEYDAGHPDLNELAQKKLIGDPVFLIQEQAFSIREQFEETAKFRGWTIVAGAIMTSHVHLQVGVFGDPDPSSMMRDFKSYASRRLNKKWKVNAPRWWTESGSKRKVNDQSHFTNVTNYILDHECALTKWKNTGERGVNPQW